MIIAKVIGTAVASAKHESLRATKLLLVCPADERGSITGSPFLAVDLVGCGEGELVMISQGSSARLASGQKDSPVDAAVIGILDSLHVEGNVRFRKE